MLRFQPVWKALGRDNSQGEVPPDGGESIRVHGHRRYVGGMWDEIGKLQADFLKAQGLTPGDVLLDIGCGSLRGGHHFIRYLDAGNYLGIDVEAELIRAGVEKELAPEVVQSKRPEFVVSGDFAFDRFSKPADFALAQSLFTHLPPAMIRRCLRRLRDHSPHCRFFATFLETPRRVLNPDVPNAHYPFRYTAWQMRMFAAATAWRCRYIGDWNHPRGQVMVEYVPR